MAATASSTSTPRAQVAWLARRAGWGLRPGQLDELTVLGPQVVVDRFVDPDTAAIATEPGPWAGLVYDADPEDRLARGIAVLGEWIRHLVETDRPFQNSVAWFWHDHFAVSYAVVNNLGAFVAHLDLLRESAFGGFRELIRDVTIDAAMLIFLDGTTSTGESPNENYGRELLELYTLGVGNYSEADVRAAAVALTGWRVAPRLGYTVRFVPGRHDDTPQAFLGTPGIRDVDGVVDTAVSHPAVAGFITAKLARHLLGDVDDPTIARLAATFAENDLQIAPLARAILEAGLDGAGTPQVTAPVPWAIAALKATGASLPSLPTIRLLRQMGQVPGNPPNVGGYPGTTTWLASSATAGRFTMANAIARATPPDAAVLGAAASGAFDELADLLLRPAGFTAATLTALRDVPRDAAPRAGEAALAVALASPDLLIR